MNPVGSCCPCLKQCIDNAPEIMMWIGVATSVVGIACTFFSGLSLWYTAAFAILGVVTLLGTCWMEEYATQDAFIERLQETNSSLRGEVQRFGDSNTLLGQRVENLEVVNGSLQDRANDLEKTNNALVKTNEALKQNNDAYSKANIELRIEIEALKKTSETIKQQLLNLKYEAEELGKTREGFEEFGRKLGTSLLAINEDITTSHKLCEKMKEVLNSQKNDLSQNISTLTGLVQDLKASNSINEKFQMLSSLQEDLKTRIQELNNSKLQANELRLLIETLKNEHKKAWTELQNVNSELKENTEKLSLVSQGLERNAQKLSNATQGAIYALGNQNFNSNLSSIIVV
jgi:FtsZ-binding cell division protein ZapB